MRVETNLNKRKSTKVKMDEFFKDLKLELSKNGDVDLLPLRAEDRFVVIQNNPLIVIARGEHPLRGKKNCPALKRRKWISSS